MSIPMACCTAPLASSTCLIDGSSNSSLGHSAGCEVTGFEALTHATSTSTYHFIAGVPPRSCMYRNAEFACIFTCRPWQDQSHIITSTNLFAMSRGRCWLLDLLNAVAAVCCFLQARLMAGGPECPERPSPSHSVLRSENAWDKLSLNFY